MLLLLHVFIAVSSLIFSGYVLHKPSIWKLRLSGALIACTVITGAYLVFSTHSPLLAACTSGLVYLSIVMTASIAAKYRLIASLVSDKE